MKQKDNLCIYSIRCLITGWVLMYLIGCNDRTAERRLSPYDVNAIESILISADSLQTFPFVEERVGKIKEALKNPLPVLLCGDSLNGDQQLAQLIALNDQGLVQFVRNPENNLPYRNEVFGVYPARHSDLAGITESTAGLQLFRIDLYNYGLNLASYAIVDLKGQRVLSRFHQAQSQPPIPAFMQKLAIDIAASSPEVQEALGYKPGEKDALMAGTQTALNRSRCERSRHLCVAPTFIKNDKALWAIVDLTDHRLVGVRWTPVGNTGPAAALTERKLQDDKITSCYCEQEQALSKNGWSLKYLLTSSDGLRVSDVSFNGKPILRNAKLVDWHVSYSGTDGFGYSDAVGCPYFSQAAVIAWEIPKVKTLVDDQQQAIGFVLEQVFRSEGWPTPCNYNYVQRYEFYNDGKFRVSAASNGRGCGSDGTYRPVFRIAFAGEQNDFANWDGKTWANWKNEQWMSQNSLTNYTKEGYLYKLAGTNGGFWIEPGMGQFKDGGRGDFSYVYITRQEKDRDEGENDLSTIGPCCNTDYQQGPEKFIGTNPENIEKSSLVLWYVAQLKNDDGKGNEYCWAESILQNGVYVTKAYPCFAGPMFIPIK